MSDAKQQAASRGAGSRPRGVMRERILDVSLELFTTQGYDKTSLREIAERLEVTKAALYYHFRSKEDILLELHLRLHRIGQAALERMDGWDSAEAVAAGWPDVMGDFIDTVVENGDLFALHQRNQQAFEKFRDDPRHLAEQDSIEQRFREVLGNPAIPLEQRVRMACSVGAIMMGLGVQSMIDEDVPPGELADIVRGIVGKLAP